MQLLVMVVFIFTLLKAEDIFLNETFIADYLSIDSTNKYKLFFWLFKSRDKNSKAPLVIFLNGGPGSSCEEVVLLENGPYRITDNLELVKNEYSYINNNDVLYIDQPIGTGFSTCTNISRIPKNQSQIAKDLTYFFNQFFTQYKEYKGRNIFITGQNFAGHYIPSTVPYLLEHIPEMNVKGISIGNPVINFKTYVENNIYSKFALEVGLIDWLMYVIAGVQEWLCNIFIKYGLLNKFTMMICENAIKLPLVGMNPYDYTTKCQVKDTCYDFTRISRFLEKPEVQKRLKIEGKKWRYTDQNVSNALAYDNFNDYTDGFTDLLDKNIPIILYYGDLDFTSNYIGGLTWLKQLKWKYTNQLLNQTNATLNYADKVIGKFKAYHLFNFIIINNASHFVTMSRPELGPLLIDLLAGRGVYKFKYSSGIVEVPIGSPSKTYRFLLSNTYKVILELHYRIHG